MSEGTAFSGPPSCEGCGHMVDAHLSGEDVGFPCTEADCECSDYLDPRWKHRRHQIAERLLPVLKSYEAFDLDLEVCEDIVEEMKLDFDRGWY